MIAVTSENFRRVAGLTAVIAGITLLTRLGIRLQQSSGIFDALSYMSQYFTILTNVLAFMTLGLIACGITLNARAVRAVIVAITCVGLIYHALLAHLVSLSGIDWISDHGLHTIVPLCSLLWWLRWGSNPQLRWYDPLLWLVWPLLYSAYIIAQASFSGFYPYPFLNVSELGYPAVTLNLLGLSVGFVLVGFALSTVASWLQKGR